MLKPTETITISVEQLEQIIKTAFNKGECGGVTYSSWFQPNDENNAEHLKDCIEICKKQLK